MIFLFINIYILISPPHQEEPNFYEKQEPNFDIYLLHLFKHFLTFEKKSSSQAYISMNNDNERARLLNRPGDCFNHPSIKVFQIALPSLFAV